MGLFFPDDPGQFQPGRAVGFARYKELLEENFKEFFLVGFMTLVCLLPFGLGMLCAVLSESSLVMLASGILGGAAAGPGVACMYDLILRRLRDDKSDWWVCYKKSMGQNWRAALLPGVVQCVFLGSLIFSGALLWWAQAPVSAGTVILLLLSATLFLAVLSLWWPQVVLFDQRTGIRLKNAVGFLLLHPGRGLGAAVLQVAWWLITFLLLPWSALLIPFLNVWYLLFLVQLILYRPMDEAFRIEAQIRDTFPDQIRTYEDEYP